MISDIHLPAEVAFHQTIDECGPEHIRVMGGAPGHGVEKQRLERTTQPVVGGEIESDLLPP